MNPRPHPFTLRQLQYARAVAEHLSFRRAAEVCHVAQPSLSAQVAELEQALGVQLFERDRRRVLITARGQALLERARQVLLQADDLGDAAKRVADPFTGTLRIGVIPTIAPYLVPAATAGVRAAFPKLTIAWIEDKTQTLIAELSTGGIDGAVLALEAELGDVEHAVIASDPFVLVTPPGHPLVQKDTPIPARELRATDMLLLDEGHCLRQQALEVCASVKGREAEFRATSLSTLVQLVVQGAGVTLLPALALGTETSRAALGIRQIAAPVPARTIALIWRKGASLAPALARVAASIRESYPAVGLPLPTASQGIAARDGRKRKRMSRAARDAVS
ncbi:MAG TPA: LysR substrate-binding domain-containing protein [Polyangiaceae bacterium]|nr:LysR substrate-binding domain-containing protein [Polyangiaceae bacterium]